MAPRTFVIVKLDLKGKLSIALQTKRFKVVLTQGEECISLEQQKIATLMRQCNDTRLLGFHEVYCLIIVMIDSQSHPAQSILHRCTSDCTFRRLYHFVKRQPLDQRVGVVFLELTQPTQTSFSDLGMIAVGVDQIARPVEQTGEFTETIARWAQRQASKGRVDESRLTPLQPEGVNVHAHEEVVLRLIKGSIPLAGRRRFD